MKNIVPALIRAKRNFKPLIEDCVNPYYKSKYVSLKAILHAVEPALMDEGLILSTEIEGNIVTTRLIHGESEEVLESKFNIPEMLVNHGAALEFATLQADYNLKVAEFKQSTGGYKIDIPATVNPIDPQKSGSAISYARRYTISALLQLSVDMDDDGNGAIDRPEQRNNNSSYSYQNKPPTVKSNGSKFNQNQRVKDICHVLGYHQDSAREWLQNQDVKSFSDLKPQQVDSFINSIWQMWGTHNGIEVNSLPAGCNAALVKQWCEQAVASVKPQPQPQSVSVASNPRDAEASKIFRLLEYPEEQAKGWLKKTHNLAKFSELPEIDYLSFIQAVANSWGYTQSMAGGSSLEDLDIPDTPPSAKYEDVEKWYGQIIDGLFNKTKKARLKVLSNDQPA